MKTEIELQDYKGYSQEEKLIYFNFEIESNKDIESINLFLKEHCQNKKNFIIGDVLNIEVLNYDSMFGIVNSFKMKFDLDKEIKNKDVIKKKVSKI